MWSPSSGPAAGGRVPALRVTRRGLCLLAAAGLAAVLGGCGWRLRGSSGGYSLGGRLIQVRDQAGRAGLRRAVRQAIDEDMVEATRIHAVEKGLDPAEFAMVAFGGAGPVHAASVARRLGVSEVLLPVGAGVASAHGCLAQAPAFERTRSWPGGLAELDLSQVDALLGELEADCRARLDHAGAREVTVERDGPVVHAQFAVERGRLRRAMQDRGEERAVREANPSTRRAHLTVRRSGGIMRGGTSLEIVPDSDFAGTPYANQAVSFAGTVR